MQSCLRDTSKLKSAVTMLEDNEHLFRVGDRALMYRYRDLIKRCNDLIGQSQDNRPQAEIIPFYKLKDKRYGIL